MSISHGAMIKVIRDENRAMLKSLDKNLEIEINKCRNGVDSADGFSKIIEIARLSAMVSTGTAIRKTIGEMS